MLLELGHYTLEGLIVHELGNVFNTVNKSSLMIRVATLIERLESIFRKYGKFMTSRGILKDDSEEAESTKSSDKEGGAGTGAMMEA